jgi:hypothetical protein
LPGEQVIVLIVIDWQPLNRSQAQSKGGEGDQVGSEQDCPCLKGAR